MRSALICVFFTLIAHKEGSRAEDDDFRPTPIPLGNWSGEKQEAAGTLQEFIKTDAPPTIAVLPAHYWEDALRHSVYLTLVRDKIDQLIAKGAVVPPDSKPDNNISKEVDDHDLWEKIKTAPFDRLKEDPLPPGDVVILARGRLLEDKDGYRFAEDDKFPEKCKDNCTQAVKAYWSVKRVRQGETAPGKYHYELTFAVTSQATRKLKKPYENPVRTFTIKENTPAERPPPPQMSRNYAHQHRPERAQRAIWIHKNIPNYPKRQSDSLGLDRIFSSFFSDGDNNDEVVYRRKPHTYIPHVHPQQQQQPKIGYVNDRDLHHQRVIPSYPSKLQSFRYPRPPLPPPPLYLQHSYPDDQGGQSQHTSFHHENIYQPNPIKTTKQAVLPTPLTNFQLLKESSVDVPVRTTLNATDPTTKEPETLTTPYKAYSHKSPPTRVNYFPENIRPPVYNAPPGVFVSMDKKPFKPMPPLKLFHKPIKTMPFDFRPSPQILDNTYADTDSSADTAFRPITLNLTDIFNSKKGHKAHRKPTAVKKPPKKHDNIKSYPYRLTTVSPDIITVRDESNYHDELDWAEILGAFTKTTPMGSHNEMEKIIDIDFSTSTTASPSTTTEKLEETSTKSTTTSTRPSTTTITTSTTTPKPKRTRPPPKFTKPEKVKKHKRVTTTTTTTSTTTTAKPLRKHKRPSDDLTPQASSAASSGANSLRETTNEPTSINLTSTTTTPSTTTTSTTPTTPRTTTTKVLTLSSTTSTTTTESEPSVATTQPKSKNRFRQSTLMQKGTSVNHDKWSMTAPDRNKTTPNLTGKFPLRRKASKFQGYIPSSTPRLLDTERNKEDHEDHGFSSNKENISNDKHNISDDKQVKTQQHTERIEEKLDNYKDDDTEDTEVDATNEDSQNDVQESKDDEEYIFPATKTPQEEQKVSTTENIVVASTHSTVNKTKCKRKKHSNLTSTENSNVSWKVETTTVSQSVIPVTSTRTTSTTPISASALFEELMSGFTMDDESLELKSTEAPEPAESESAKLEQFIPIDEDLEEFLNTFEPKNNHTDKYEPVDEEYEEEDDDEDSPFNNGEDSFDSRNLSDEYYEDSAQDSESQSSKDRPISLLELMAME